MAIGMVLVGFGRAKPDRHVHHDVGHKVRQGMQGVGQQGHASEQDATNGLNRSEDEVDESTGEGDASRCAVLIHDGASFCDGKHAFEGQQRPFLHGGRDHHLVGQFPVFHAFQDVEQVRGVDHVHR